MQWPHECIEMVVNGLAEALVCSIVACPQDLPGIEHTITELERTTGLCLHLIVDMKVDMLFQSSMKGK